MMALAVQTAPSMHQGLLKRQAGLGRLTASAPREFEYYGGPP